MMSMKFPVPLKREKLVFSSGIATIGANSTQYLYSLDQGGENNGQINATETHIIVTYLVTRPGILRNLVVKSNGFPGAGETYIYTVRVNGAPTALTATIAGGAQRDGSDLVNSVVLVVGDRIRIQVVTSLAAAVNEHSASIDLEMNMARLKFNRISFTSGTGTIAAGLTRYIGSLHRFIAGGTAATNETDITANYLVTRPGTVRNMVVKASVPPGGVLTYTYTLRLNGVNTALALTITGAVQDTTFDAVNVVKVVAGDRLTVRVQVAGGAASTQHLASFDFEEGEFRTGW